MKNALGCLLAAAIVLVNALLFLGVFFVADYLARLVTDTWVLLFFLRGVLVLGLGFLFVFATGAVFALVKKRTPNP